MSEEENREADPDMVTLPEGELQTLYGTLSDATTAAATGGPNRCASLAADAKDHVLQLHEEFADE